MWIKLCGTTNLPDAQLAINHGADALGFIFAPSKRHVTVEQAAEIIERLPPNIERVGVFTEASVPEIVHTVRQAALTAVQLHFPHDPAFTQKLKAELGEPFRIIQVLGVETGQLADAQTQSTALADALKDCFADPALWAVLLDTVKNGQSGGLGLPFSWSRSKPSLDAAVNAALNAALDAAKTAVAPAPYANSLDSTAATPLSPPRIILAGGLHAGNVAAAIDALQPWGVDCVTGVEHHPGHKDPSRVQQFIAAARHQPGAPNDAATAATPAASAAAVTIDPFTATD